MESIHPASNFVFDGNVRPTTVIARTEDGISEIRVLCPAAENMPYMDLGPTDSYPRVEPGTLHQEVASEAEARRINTACRGLCIACIARQNRHCAGNFRVQPLEDGLYRVAGYARDGKTNTVDGITSAAEATSLVRGNTGWEIKYLHTLTDDGKPSLALSDFPGRLSQISRLSRGGIIKQILRGEWDVLRHPMASFKKRPEEFTYQRYIRYARALIQKRSPEDL